MNCIRVCPFNKSSGWLHEAVRWLVKKTPWLDPFLVRMDELLGYGRKVRASNFWGRHKRPLTKGQIQKEGRKAWKKQ